MKPAVLLACILISITGYSQTISSDTIPNIVNDTTVAISSSENIEPTDYIEIAAPEHDPKVAGALSAALPGLGQIYNKKYWKLPFVWGGIGGFVYFIDLYNDRYQGYRRNLIYEIEQDPNFVNDTQPHLEQEILRRAKDTYRRNRDQLMIYAFFFYLLNIADAHIDAHLIEFDVNQGLSVKIEPTFDIGQSLGLSVSLKF